MSTPNKGTGPTPRSHRPRALTVFAAAFVAGAAAAVCLNQALDVHLAQAKPQIEQEPIFVALRSLPQGSPVTVWDVALREWPKAMLPTTAMRATDSFDGLVVKYPLREGQPVLSVQLVRTPPSSAGPLAAQPQQAIEHPATIPSERVAQPAVVDPAPQADLWTPADQVSAAPIRIPSDATSSSDQTPYSDQTSSKQSPSSPVLRPTPVQTTPVAATVAAALPSPSPIPERKTAADIDGPTTGDVEPWTSAPAAAPTKPKDPVVRYLVVPEHIAAQADLSFVTPSQPKQQPAAATSAPQKAATAKTATTKALTAQTATAKTTVVKPGVAKPVQSAAARQQAGRAKSPAVQPQPNARQTPAQTAGSGQAGSGQAGSRLDSMFPNLAAGIDAVEIELRRIRRDRGRQAEASEQGVGSATTSSQSQPAKAARSPALPPDRSASRP
jgi:hypothetical protein